MPGTPSPLALRGARRPGWPGTPTARHHDHHAAAELRHATTDVPRTRILASPCTPTPPVAKPPAHDHHRTSNSNLPGPLDNHLLTLVMGARPVDQHRRACRTEPADLCHTAAGGNGCPV